MVTTSVRLHVEQVTPKKYRAQKSLRIVMSVVAASQAIDEHKYYEALQFYQSFYARNANNVDKLPNLIEKMSEGCLKFLAVNEVNCGAEMLKMLLELYSKRSVPVTQENVGRLLVIFDAIPSDKYEENKIIAHTKAASAWSQTSDAEHGSAVLHDLFGAKYKQVANLPASNSHYLRGTDTASHVELIVEWAGLVSADERDLVFARAVLHGEMFDAPIRSLCFRRLYTANELITVAQRECAPASPLLNAVAFVVQTCERESGAGGIFTELRTRYAPSFARDPLFAQYLDCIGKEYFNIELAVPRGGGDMFSMLSSMMGGMRGAGAASGGARRT